MPVGTHRSFDGAKEHLAPTFVFLTIPGVRCATVKLPEGTQQNFDIGRLDQYMIMIRQHTPDEYLTGVSGKDCEQIFRKGMHPFRPRADKMPVLIASC